MTRYSRKYRRGGSPPKTPSDYAVKVSDNVSHPASEESLAPSLPDEPNEPKMTDTRTPEQVRKAREEYLMRKRYDELPNRIKNYGRQGEFTRIDEGDDNDYYNEEDWKNDDNFVDYDNDGQNAGRKRRKSTKKRKTTRKRKTTKKRYRKRKV